MTTTRWVLAGTILMVCVLGLFLFIRSSSIGTEDVVNPATTVPSAPATTSSGTASPESTNTPAPTTTSTSGADSAVIWEGDVETGNVDQWTSVSISGNADVAVVPSPVHSGNFALQLINWDVDGNHNPGVRMNLQGPFGSDPANLPDDLYYSAWYFIPFAFEGHSNIFQFKQSDATAWNDDGDPTEHTRRMVWKTGLYWTGDGTYDLEIRTRIDPDTGEWQPESIRLGIVEADIPVGEWFHLEIRYVWGQNSAGRTTVWLNGKEVWDREASTEASNLECLHRCREWVVSHYLSDYQGYVAPGDSWIFIDDARLATARVGPG